ncbi:MAG: GH25 family lysozyme [Eubacteriales bacterium]
MLTLNIADVTRMEFSVKLTDDFQMESKKMLPLLYMTVGVTVFIIGLLLGILYLNRDQLQKQSQSSNVQQSQVQSQSEEVVGNSLDDLIGNVSAGDLNIWYLDDFTSDEPITSTEKPKYEAAQEKLEAEELELYEEEQKRLEEELKAQDPSEGGTKTMVVTSDGEEWVKINPYLDKNSYRDDGFVTKSSKMTYSEDGELLSIFGIDISEKSGEINFASLKKAGVEFVMIQLGSRGYQTGVISIDSYFHEFAQGAIEAGIEVGIYFDSQAITDDEMREEVAFIRSQIMEYDVSYPIVLRMEEIKRDQARTDGLTTLARTDLAQTFADEVKSAGYIPMLYGTKEFLLTSVDLAKLTSVDIWFSGESDVPDYPYDFQMWKYSTGNKISGITGNITNYTITLIDYTKK